MPILRSRVTSKGQITIPVEIRKRLGISEGDQVEFDTTKAETVIRPVRKVDDPFEKWRGAIGGFPGGRKEVDAWIREMRGRDEDER
ncbi:MAG TPA: AbrB/MazE/SpoVT family DNA-binding domain-containing protein [Bryobacteraceae bacterium]|jgi:antitoxin PrlF|nr:AbrB/MazE/SpoVT family DNA-binding domain-containing protein [Bryobacteraceae bacterium]